MPQESVIHCPQCGQSIEITAILLRKAQEEVRQQVDDYKKKLDDQIKAKDLESQREIAARDKEWQAKLDAEKKLIEESAKAKAKVQTEMEIADLREQVKVESDKRQKLEAQELQLRKERRDLEDMRRNAELENARKLDQERARIRQETAEKLALEHQLKDRERDKMIEDLRQKLADASRQVAQGSQQMQGEILELEIEDMLRAEFRTDSVEPVKKGTRGGDILQTVVTQSGRVCGTILWEMKRTKAWSDTWMQKLKDDQREAKADVAVIVSEALPKDSPRRFHIRDGVWVTDLSSAMSLAIALRVTLTEVAKARFAAAGQGEKMELVYHYVTGREFASRVEAIIECYNTMQADLISEKNQMEKIWAKREKQMTKVTAQLCGMKGDLEGISGASLPAMKMLEIEREEIGVQE